MAKELDTEQIYSKFFGEKSFSRNRERDRMLLIERMYQRVLIELCVNRFKWKGLPDTIDERYLELTLFHRALCVFYFDDEFNRYMALNAAAVGRVNMYDNPTSFQITGNTMVNKTLSPKQCVPIWANYMRVPDIDIVLVYANKLAEIDRTIEINSKNMRKNKLVYASPNTQLSMQNINSQIQQGQADIYVRKGQFDPNDIVGIDIGIAPKTLEELILAREKMWSNAMTLLGINNSNQDKKERLVTDEVTSNEEQIDQMKNIALNARKQACKRINKMFPSLSVSVDFTTHTDPEMPQLGDLGDQEEMPDEQDDY